MKVLGITLLAIALSQCSNATCSSAIAAARSGRNPKVSDGATVFVSLLDGMPPVKLHAMAGRFVEADLNAPLKGLLSSDKVELCNWNAPVEVKRQFARGGPTIRAVDAKESTLIQSARNILESVESLSSIGGSVQVVLLSMKGDEGSNKSRPRQLANRGGEEQYLKTTPEILTGVLLLVAMALVVVLGVCCVSSIGTPQKFALVGMPPSKVH